MDEETFKRLVQDSMAQAGILGIVDRRYSYNQKVASLDLILKAIVKGVYPLLPLKPDSRRPWGEEVG